MHLHKSYRVPLIFLSFSFFPITNSNRTSSLGKLRKELLALKYKKAISEYINYVYPTIFYNCISVFVEAKTVIRDV